MAHNDIPSFWERMTGKREGRDIELPREGRPMDPALLKYHPEEEAEEARKRAEYYRQKRETGRGAIQKALEGLKKAR